MNSKADAMSAAFGLADTLSIGSGEFSMFKPEQLQKDNICAQYTLVILSSALLKAKLAVENDLEKETKEKSVFACQGSCVRLCILWMNQVLG